MARKFRVRDRDAPVTDEGIILRVYGYSHPSNAAICDAEYASDQIYHSHDIRALRKDRKSETIYYKFYSDEGLQFIKSNHPQYQIYYEPLQKWMVGIRKEQIAELRKPETKLQQLITGEKEDLLISSGIDVLDMIFERSNLRSSDFGIFGSILHDFHHISYSDIDFIIYGRKPLNTLLSLLADFYSERESSLRNEFEGPPKAGSSSHWMFKDYSAREYVWHERRKLIWAVFNSKSLGRRIKVEFEPVRNWNEIRKEPKSLLIEKAGWIRCIANVLAENESYYMPSIYPIEVEEIMSGTRVENIIQAISYVEEFRMQARAGERVLIEGNLEKVTVPKGNFHQITLTYGPRYHNQVMKVL
ncbi:MAG: hypothetical protein ACFE7E_00440 [Candidatus Hodarchaeota archaeon]